jgi:Cyclic nucleotide-binding domain
LWSIGAPLGAFVSAFSYGITALQRRWTTAQVVLTIGPALVVFNVLARLGLFTPVARSVSLALMVSYFLGLQMAFITLGLLAGRLFDIRQMKRFFPSVLSGFHVGFILIIEGEVEVHRAGHPILRLGPGKSVGELAVLDPEPQAASVTAVLKTRLFRIHKDAFDEVMADRPEIASSVIRALCQRLRLTTTARPA